MEISNTLSAASIAKQGINQGFDRLAQHSHDIATSLVDHQAKETNPSPEINYEALNQYSKNSLETSIVNMQRTKVQIQSLAKVLEVENKLFEDSLGRIFDTKV